MDQSAKPVLLIGLLLAVGIIGYLTLMKTESVSKDVDAIDTAAGNVDYGEGATEPNMASPEPFVHCYDVKSTDELDPRTRMDFEARTSKGWVAAPDASPDGKLCLRESPTAVQERLEAHSE